MNAEALTYAVTDGKMTVGKATTLNLLPDAKYDVRQNLDIGRRGHYDVALLDTWLAAVRAHYEQPTWFVDLVVGRKLRLALRRQHQRADWPRVRSPPAP